MKIRIKGNSIRLRLTKTDISQLKELGRVKEKTVIHSHQIFEYTLEVSPENTEIYAHFEFEKIRIFLPTNEAKTLIETQEIGVQNIQDNGIEGGLYILIEKDLICLHTKLEDQSDRYDHPKIGC